MTRKNKRDYEAEFLLAWHALAPKHAPQITRQARFHPRRKWRFDFAFLAQRVAVEIDGGQWLARGGRHARDSDREKQNNAVILGWRVMHYSPEMLEHPERVVKEILSALAYRERTTQK